MWQIKQLAHTPSGLDRRYLNLYLIYSFMIGRRRRKCQVGPNVFNDKQRRGVRFLIGSPLVVSTLNLHFNQASTNISIRKSSMDFLDLRSYRR